MSKKIIGDNNTMISGNSNTVTFKIEGKKTNIIVPTPPNSISEAQAAELKKLVDAIALRGEKHQAIWKTFKNKFSLTKYTHLPKERYDEAVTYLKQWKGSSTRNLQKKDNYEYRKVRYAAIYAKIRELGILKENFSLELKKIYGKTSLTDLNDVELEQVYNTLFSRGGKK